jgi:NAD(P)-dependent dehydrogenase (short-subunit alcohol dehydrogenase family)
MTDRLVDKVIVVTGAAKGIGRGCAEALAAEGAAVVLGDVLAGEGSAAARALQDSGLEATFKHTDVRREQDCAALMEHAVSTYGRIDGLLNNVGWFPRGTIEETTAELWDEVQAVNLRSAFFCSKHAVPHLRAAGGGSIVNMGSPLGIQGLPNVVAYAAAKGGLLNLTRTLAGAYAADRVRVNYLLAGWILTDTEVALQKSRGLADEDLKRAGAGLPLGRHQTVGDVANAAIYLLSDESSQVTAAILNVDAGVTMMPVYSGTSGYVG